MSVWSDMEDRGTGDLLKKEDDKNSLVEIDLETSGLYTKAEINQMVNNIPDQQITMVGTLDASGLPAGYVPQKGQLFYINEDCNMGHKGDMIIYTGNFWVQVDTVTTESDVRGFDTSTGIPVNGYGVSTMYATIK